MTDSPTSELALHADAALVDRIDKLCRQAGVSISSVVASLIITTANVIGQFDHEPTLDEKLAYAVVAAELLVSYTQYVHTQTTSTSATRN